MHALYRKRLALPSLLLAVLAAGCDGPPQPASRQAGSLPDAHLEALQEAEALRHNLEQRRLEEQRIDELLGRTDAPAGWPD